MNKNINLSINITNLKEVKKLLSGEFLKQLFSENKQSTLQSSKINPLNNIVCKSINDPPKGGIQKKRKKKKPTFNVENRKSLSDNDDKCNDGVNFYINTDISGNKLSKPVIPIYLENDPFVYIVKQSINTDTCNEIIQRFENDERKTPGITSGGLNKEKKNTVDLPFSCFEEWKDIDYEISKLLTIELKNYCRHNLILMKEYYNVMSNSLVANFENVVDFGYQIQYYKKTEGHYVWHHDLTGNENKTSKQQRLVTFIWYLNDVEIGGETEFLHGLVKPEAGKLIIFPACFTYFHRAHIPISNDKYIITGWIGYKIIGYE
jgi:hypothetical protein